MDRDRAIDTYRQAVAADPEDAAAYRGLASALWLSITFRRGNMTVDDYLGRVSRTKAPPAPPPPEAAAAFRDALDKALALARKRLDANPRDADAHYQVGAAAGLRASYTATVEGRADGRLSRARETRTKNTKRSSPSTAAARTPGFIVGTYRYIVSTLALPARWVAYVAGFGGGRDRGLRMIEDAAAYPGDNQVDARLALVLIYNRERRYDDALKQLAVLRDQFPRNRLLWLETGSTNLRAGRPADAARVLTDGMSRFANDTRPKMFGEEALWLFKRGAAHAALGQTADAEQDLRKAVVVGRPAVGARPQPFRAGKAVAQSRTHGRRAA